MIEFEQVSKSYDGSEVIHSISLQIPDRHTFVLLGKSGSGKTTTLKMINRLIEMDSGTITINGRSIKEQPKFQLRRSIGYVIQHMGLFPHMRVDENIATVPRLLGWDKSRVVERIDYLAKILSLDQDLLVRYPNELSGGQQQRVGLARALATDPDVILMDEPFGALDPITRNDIQHLFLTMEEMMHKTVVMVTHDVKEAFKLGDQICLMEDGNILQVGTPGELLFNPVNESVEEFFQSIRPELEQDVLTLQDLYLHLNQENFEFNRYPFPPSLSVSALMRNLEMVDAPIPEREKVFRAFEKIKRDKQNRKSS